MQPAPIIPPSTPAWVPAFHLKASRQPMLWAAIAYSSGIVAGAYLWRPALWWMVAGAEFLLAAAYFAQRRSAMAWTLALSALSLAGALHMQSRTGEPRIDTSIQPYADREELQITAHVIRDGRLQQGSFNEIKQTVDVETEELQTESGQSQRVHSGIRLSLYIPRSNSTHAPEAVPQDAVPNDATPEEISKTRATIVA